MYTSPDALTWAELTPDSAVSTTAITAPVTGVIVGNQTVTILAANINVVPGMIIKSSTNVTYGTVVSVTNSTTFVCNIVAAVPAANPGVALTLNSPLPWSMIGNVVTIASYLSATTYLKIQLNENTLWDSNGSYSYTRLTDVIDNFLIAYVGAGKLIPSVKRTDVIFHAKRGLQEFSYDTLKSIKSQT